MQAGTAEEIIPRWHQEGYRANAVIVDPIPVRASWVQN